MTVEGQVNRLTKVRPHVVIGQIHGASDDVTVFRVEGDKLWITDGDNAHGYLLDSAFALGKRYSIGFDVDGGIISLPLQRPARAVHASQHGCGLLLQGRQLFAVEPEVRPESRPASGPRSSSTTSTSPTPDPRARSLLRRRQPVTRTCVTRW
jgi:hypothetical protein